MSILDNLAEQGENQWLSQKLEDNPETDEALKTTARIATAHIWPFLASSISDDDYRNRRGVKRDEVLYICGSIGPHVASVLVDHVLAGFDNDYAVLRHTAQEEAAAIEDILPWLAGGGRGGEDQDGDEDNPGLFDAPKTDGDLGTKTSAIHQAPGGGVHGPYYIRQRGGDWVVVNAKGEVKGTHGSKEEARAQQKALYVHVPEAREQAESREGKAPPKAVQEVGSPGSEEQREHEGALHQADGDPYGKTTLFPSLGKGEDQDEDENVSDEEKRKEYEPPLPVQSVTHKGPGLFEAPKTDSELEDPGSYYGLFGPGGQMNMNKAAAIDRYGHIRLVNIHEEPRRPWLVVDRYGHIRLGARQSWRRDPENDDFDWDRYEDELEQRNRTPESDVYHHPEEDRPYEEADWERPHEEGWHEHGNWSGGAGERNPRTSVRSKARPMPYDEEDLSWLPDEQGEPGYSPRDMDEELKPNPASWAMSHRELLHHMMEHHFGPGLTERQKGLASNVLRLPHDQLAAVHDNVHDQDSPMTTEHGPGSSLHHFSAEKEKGEVPCPICHKKFEPGELAEHMRTVHHVSEGGDKDPEYQNRVPGRAKPGQSKPKPSAGRQTHKPSRGGQHKAPHKEGQLVRSPQRPPGARRSPVRAEMGYDPSEAFPGYYGEAQAPRRPRTAQAPLAGQADVPAVGGPGSAPSTPAVATPPATPQSGTGASGQFNPGAALSAAGPSGMVSGDFSTSDAPQDIQSQLGQLPTMGHKIGVKLTQIAADALAWNPGLSTVAAMELALQVVRLYPKVAHGGSDYLAEPGTEGVPTETLVACPQCQWQAYNRQINRCHNCGFWDTGLEPSIEVT